MSSNLYTFTLHGFAATCVAADFHSVSRKCFLDSSFRGDSTDEFTRNFTFFKTYIQYVYIFASHLIHQLL
jgi:hypothetical protein